MASRKELRALITLAGKVDPSLSKALMKASGQQAKMADKLKKTNKQFQKGRKLGSQFGDMLKASFVGSLAARAVANLGREVSAFTGKALDMASGLVEVQNVIDTTFGDSSRDISSWSKTLLKDFGLTELQGKQWAGSMGAMLKSSGIAAEDMKIMSKGLVELSGDMSSFYNLDHDVMWTKIRSGISGETEGLKELGINMTVANLQAYALSKGIKKKWTTMSQAEQTLLRYKYLMEKTTDAQGDYAKTLDTSWENQKRLFKNNLLQKLSSALSKFTPQLTELTKKANELVEKIDFESVINAVATAFSVLGSTVKFVADHFNILFPLISGGLVIMAGFKILSTVNALMAAWKLTTFAQTLAQHGLNAALTANPIGIVIVAIGALVAAGMYLYKNWDKITEWLGNLWSTFVTELKADWDGFTEWITGLWQDNILPFFQGIGEWFNNLWNGIVEQFMSAWSGITNWFSNLWNGIVNIFKGFMNIFIGIFNFVIGALNKIHFKVPKWVPGIGGKEVGVNIPKLKEFAYGGIATQASIFGEAGPEMAIPLKRSTRSLSLLNQTATMLGVKGNGGPTLIFHIHESSDAKMTAREIISVVKDYFNNEERVSYA